MNHIHCIMFTGLPLTDEIRNLLFEIAQGMISTKKGKGTIKTPYIEGTVTTKWHRRGLGSTYGYEFVANIETEKDSTTNKITYIVKDEPVDTADTKWITTEDTGLSEPFCLN